MVSQQVRLYFWVILLAPWSCDAFFSSFTNHKKIRAHNLPRLQCHSEEQSGQEYHAWNNIHSKFHQCVYSGVLAAMLIMPGIAEAKVGDAPKIEFNLEENSTPAGPALYSEKDQAIIESKMKTITKTWDSMTGKVEVFLNKGNKKEAKVAIANGMGSLKLDMRTVSKVACEGDISVKSKPGSDVVAFDYNSGQFQLKPVAAKAESAITKMNDIYFSSGDAQAMLSMLDEAKSLFNEWVTLL
eukprot:CAMPEP_0113933982 /NCGR_PEP_ID=MMETSP1339-20121228/1335_1 /TAXON_ID=94617 /ORGANISM="Fibrocapsa japonica" /LENGTH=240 /DNA_ID=CAMNT_0000935577 /DNA_START=21 /DNA_END=743 /DNA_ORIENTATION=- /assembly_acc=CAM_ASM_000762